MYRETLEAILSVNFSLFGENFITSFVQPEKKWQIMGEVCDVGPKNLRKNLPEARRFYAAVLNIC